MSRLYPGPRTWEHEWSDGKYCYRVNKNGDIWFSNRAQTDWIRQFGGSDLGREIVRLRHQIELADLHG